MATTASDGDRGKDATGDGETKSTVLSIAGTDGDDLLLAQAESETFDGGLGRDTVSYRGSTAGVTVILPKGQGFGGFAAGDWLISIENLTGSLHDDKLIGDDGRNVLKGGAGDDWLVGQAGRDRLSGGSGDDMLRGGSDPDVLLGGKGIDGIDYSRSAAAVTVSLQSRTGSGGDAGGDTIRSVENVFGSGYGDRLDGDGGANLLDGGRGDDLLRGHGGDDVLVGGSGADTLIGGGGSDWASYARARDGVNVDLATGLGSASDAAGDRLVSIENLEGSSHNDTLLGDGHANQLVGGDGLDILKGQGGDDRLDGGRGNDFLIGGDGADKILGGDGDDLIDGGKGRDVIKGGAGNDIIYGGPDPDIICYDAAWEDLTATYDGSDYSIWVVAPDGTDHIFTALTIASATGTYRFDVPSLSWIYESAMTGDDWLA